MGVRDRFRSAWNAFTNKDPTESTVYADIGYSSTLSPTRIHGRPGTEKSIINTVLNRISLDVANVTIRHVNLDANDRYISTRNSGLNNCLTVEANIDQTARAFKQDMAYSMMDEGFVAVVPVDTTYDPNKTESYDITTMRVGKIVTWYPEHVRVSLYNDQKGYPEEVTFNKRDVAIIENPFYSIMNEPNSTMQRLKHKLALLDVVDEESSSGKLDLIIQLPYAVKTEARRQQAENRRKDIEMQLKGSKYGIAYTDATEHITQLNRSLENNLLKQVEYLTNLFLSQLGLTTGILDGTADEKTMTNYTNRVVLPIVSAITDEFYRKFLTKTARTQRQSISFFNDPFKLVPVNDLAEIADKFTRNEIMSSNEIRQIVGLAPVNDPQADQLRNKNLNASDGQEFASVKDTAEQKEFNSPEEVAESNQNGGENGSIEKKILEHSDLYVEDDEPKKERKVTSYRTESKNEYYRKTARSNAYSESKKHKPEVW